MSSKYALNMETGEITLCRSTGQRPCPHASTEHYSSKDEAQNAFESLMNKQETLSLQRKSTTSPSYDNLPWLSHVGNHFDQINAHYEITDRFEHNGQRMILLHSDKSPYSNRDISAFTEDGAEVSTSEVRDEETGERIGFLKTVQYSDASLEASFGKEDDYMTYFKYGERYHSLFYDFDDDPKESIENMKKLWKSVASSSVVRSHPQYSVTSMGMKHRHANGRSLNPPESMEEIESDLKESSKFFQEEYMKRFDPSTRSYAFVEYSEINESHRGTGLGKKMYLSSARALGARGRILASSTLQTDNAQGLWKSLLKDDNDHIRIHSYDYKGEKKNNYLLDYRDKSIDQVKDGGE